MVVIELNECMFAQLCVPSDGYSCWREVFEAAVIYEVSPDLDTFMAALQVTGRWE